MTQTLQSNVSNYRVVLSRDKVESDTLKIMRFSPETTPSTTEQLTENTELPIEADIRPSDTTISATELDLEDRKLFQYAVFDILDTYLLDYSIPSEINIDGYALRFGELKVDYIKKTRLALALATAGLTVSIIAGLVTLPQPYKLAVLALCGPLFVSTYGLLTQE